MGRRRHWSGDGAGLPLPLRRRGDDGGTGRRREMTTTAAAVVVDPKTKTNTHVIQGSSARGGCRSKRGGTDRWVVAAAFLCAE